MSALDSRRASLAGLTLDDVLAKQKRSNTAQTQQAQQLVPRNRQRTLIDLIKEDESNKKDRRSWKAFKDKLRLKRAGSAWISAIRIPSSDIPIPHPNSRTFTQLGRRNSVRLTDSKSDTPTLYMANQHHDFDPTTDVSGSPPPAPTDRAQFTRRSSTRYGTTAEAPFTAGDPTEPAPAGSALRPQLSRRNSTSIPTASEPYRRGRVVTFRDSFDDDEPEDEDGTRMETGRALSAREAVAAQEAAEAAAAAEREAEAEAPGRPVTMSLMDLLEETDREMGLERSRYILSDDEDFDDEEEEEREVAGDGEGDMEYTCPVCMVRHKAYAINFCGHSYCRMCSRELSVGKGNCPLCNNFILEILEIF